MSARQYLAASGALLLLLFAGFTMLVQNSLAGARIDMTENSLFTLSDGTRQTLDEISEPIQIQLFYTRSVGQSYPSIQAYAVRVRELLQAYDALSRGKVRIVEIDPQPFSEEEDEALAAGLAPLDTNGGDPLYFGLVARNSVDEVRTIPFLAPEQETSLEYDITRMIQRLDRPEPPRIGLLSTLPGIDAVTTEAGYAILRDFDEAYTVEPIDPDFVTLPPELDVLVLIHPPEMTDWQLFQIDQYMLSQGRALFLLDPAAKTAAGDGPLSLRNRQIRSDLNRLTERWGILLDEDAVADTQTALAIQAAGADGRTDIVRHPLFMSVPAALMSSKNIITADLSRSVNFAAPGRFRLLEDAPGEREVLIESGPAPARIDAERASLDLSADATLDLYEAGDGPAILALRLTGALVTAFPDGAPEPALPEDPISRELLRAAVAEQGAPRATSTTDAELILIADADLVEDSLYLDRESGQAFADNAALILNAVDSLAGGVDLLGLRARAPGLRPMVRVERMRESAREAVARREAILEQRLQDSLARLEALQLSAESDTAPSAEGTEDMQAELDRLRRNIVETRSALREIERSYRQDIDRLEATLRVVTTLLAPVALLIVALLVYWRRRRAA